MGFNSLLFINNDALHVAVENAKEFMQKVNEQIQLGRRGSFPFERFTNYFELAWMEHSSVEGLIRVGGNMTETLTSRVYRTGPLELLRAAADNLGYRLVKKSKREKTNG